MLFSLLFSFVYVFPWHLILPAVVWHIETNLSPLPVLPQSASSPSTSQVYFVLVACQDLMEGSSAIDFASSGGSCDTWYNLPRQSIGQWRSECGREKTNRKQLHDKIKEKAARQNKLINSKGMARSNSKTTKRREESRRRDRRRSGFLVVAWGASRLNIYAEDAGEEIEDDRFYCRWASSALREGNAAGAETEDARGRFEESFATLEEEGTKRRRAKNQTQQKKKKKNPQEKEKIRRSEMHDEE